METVEKLLFNAAYLAYSLSMAGYLLYALKKNEKTGKAAFAFALLGALFHVSELALRAYIGRSLFGLKEYVPCSNWFESISLFGFVIAVTLFVALLRYLPRGWVWDRLVVQATSGGAAQIGGVAPEAASELAGLVGKRGVAATALRPGGQVEVEGRRYEAKVDVGSVDPGTAIVVTGCSDFSLTVEKAKP